MGKALMSRPSIWQSKKNYSRIISIISKYKNLYILCIPGLLILLIFSYIPMAGIIIAFKDYQPWKGPFAGSWVGFKYFTDFIHSFFFWDLIRNTLVINILKLIFSFPFPILFAILLNEISSKYLKKIVQTVSYLPNFVSWVVIVGIMNEMLAPSNGIINVVIKAFGGVPIDFMNERSWFYFLLVSSGIWKGFGWGSIIYLAAITQIDPQLFEASIIDGAGKFRRIWNITLPGIMHIVVLMLILNLGNIMSVDFEQQLLMLGSNNPYFMKNNFIDIGDVIDTYVFRQGLLGGAYAIGTAIGLFKGVICLLMVSGSNWLAKKVGQSAIW